MFDSIRIFNVFSEISTRTNYRSFDSSRSKFVIKLIENKNNTNFHQKLITRINDIELNFAMKTNEHNTNENWQLKISTMSNYLHYFLTYAPIFGTLLGGYYLSTILMKEGRPITKFVYLVFIFCSICSIYAFSITKFQNVNPQFVRQNFEWLNEKITFVYLSVSSLSLLGFLSLTGLFFFQGNYSKEISLGMVISILALFSSIFSIRSEYIHPSWKFYTTYSKHKATETKINESKLNNNETFRK